jgi:hypothetical protein
MRTKTVDWSKIDNTSKKGAAGELIACIWLLRKGYDVYRNIAPSGKVDIIALKGSIVHYIDDGFITKNSYDNYPDTKKHIAAQYQKENKNIKILYVLDNGSCVWRHVLFKDCGARKCVSCSKVYVPTKATSKTCSDKCRVENIRVGNKQRHELLKNKRNANKDMLDAKELNIL